MRFLLQPAYDAVEAYFATQEVVPHEARHEALKVVAGRQLAKKGGCARSVRTTASVLREYGNIYTDLLHSGVGDPLELRRMQQQELLTRSTIIVSHYGGLYACQPEEALQVRQDFITSVLNAIRLPRCELGCGWGWNMIPFPNAVGGDVCPAAVELGTSLGYDIHPFDFYEHCYTIIPEASLVYTVHAIEQMPDPEPFFERMVAVKDRTSLVAHFEPSGGHWFELQRDQYAITHDYTRGLYKPSETRRCLHHQPDVIGINPLNPTGLHIWEWK